MSSLHVRLIGLILLVMVPAVGLLFYTGYEHRQQVKTLIEHDAHQMAQVMTAYQEQWVTRSHQIGRALGSVPSVPTHDTVSCNATFRRLIATYPSYVEFIAANPQGEIFCHSGDAEQDESSASIDVSDRDWFQQSVESRSFVVSEVITSRVSGQQMFSFGYPVIDAAGTLQAVVGVGLNVDVLNQLMTRAELPPDSTVTLVDGEGRVVARFPESGEWAGRTLNQSPLIEAILRQQGQGTAQVVGLDEIERLYAFSVLQNQDNEQQVYAAVGIPTHALLGEINSQTQRNLVLVGIIALIEIGIVLVGGRFIITRPIQQLVEATRHISAGALDTRIEMNHGAGELRQLAFAFNMMAQTLQQNQASMQAAEARYRTLVEQLPTVIYTLALTPEGTNYISPRIQTLTGYTPDALLDKPEHWLSCIHPHDRPTVRARMEQCRQNQEPQSIEYRIMTRDEHEVWVRDDGAILVDEQGTPLMLQGTLLDITERRHASQIIESQQETLRELSTPLLHIADTVMLMPLVGTLDTQRSQQMMEGLLRGIEEYRAKVVILDITGVPVVDTQVANALIRTAQSIRLLGARVLLTGIRPEVAQALVGLGIDLSDIVTYSTLQNGIEAALRQKPTGRR